MRKENEIRERMDLLIVKIEEINNNPEKHNLFIHRDNLKK